MVERFRLETISNEALDDLLGMFWASGRAHVAGTVHSNKIEVCWFNKVGLETNQLTFMGDFLPLGAAKFPVVKNGILSLNSGANSVIGP